MVACHKDNISALLGLPQASRGLHITHFNCCSCLSHKEETFELLRLLHLDLLTLSETWLDDTVPDGKILLVECGYSMFHHDRNQHGGGVAIVQSNSLPYCPHPDLSSGQVKSIWGEPYPRSSKMSLLLWYAYRPPSKMNFYNHFLPKIYHRM